MPCLSLVTYYFYIMMTVFVIGTGNLGTQLCRALESALNPHVQLVGYSNKKGQALKDVKAPILSSVPLCDLIILSVPDDAIAVVSDTLPHSQFIVHTSGSVPMSVLERHDRHGVLYIPQTFSKERPIDFSEITICLESNTKAAMEQLEMVGSTLSRKQKHINSSQRQQLHLAAVYMNNFVNHCYFKAGEILQQESIDPNLLDPLMTETLAKAQDIGPYNAQTGPARRDDKQTLQRHLDQLQELDREMYLAISESIKTTYES